MHTLLLTRIIPFPPRGGGALRTWQTINILAEFGTVSVLCVAPGNQESTKPPGVDYWQHIGTTLSSAKSKRSFSRRLRSKAWMLRPYGHRDADILLTPEATSELSRFIKASPPDLVILEELWLYPYFKFFAGSSTKIVYDAQNVEGVLRKSIKLGDLPLIKRTEHRLLSARAEHAERRLSQSVDAVWVCSESDALTVRRNYGPNVHTNLIPNTLDHRKFNELWTSHVEEHTQVWSTPLTILFPATFGYRPNELAADVLINNIFPLVRSKLPDARLLLVGRSPTDKVLRAAAQHSGIEVTGEVPDVLPYFASSHIVVVPLFHGGGTRLKILEAFAAGRPVVSTTKGAEGLDAVDGKHLLIADSPEKIAQAILRIQSTPNLARELTLAAHILLESKYSFNAGKRAVTCALTDLRLSFDSAPKSRPA